MSRRDNPRAPIDALSDTIRPLSGTPDDYDDLIDMVGDSRFVLIGEASHGTHEFYRERIEITKRLIEEKGFTAVAAEADWPDAYRVNCYVKNASDDATSDEALSGFNRFPQWMWRNADVLDFVGWLRDYNDTLQPDATKVGFYGLDLYSLYGSMEAVISYLDKVDPEAAKRARERYSCFDHRIEDAQSYGYAAHVGALEPCEEDVIRQLIEMQQNAETYKSRDRAVAEDEYFYAEQNARLVINAEEYYRTMFSGRVSSWNLRDCHMADTLDALAGHLSRHGEQAKIVIWAHNSHLGDARATEMGWAGELNIGQLVRERYDRDSVLIGFSTYEGSVTAASDWGDPAERKRVRPGLSGSYEALFHDLEVPRFLLPLRDGDNAIAGVPEQRLQRAIGVIYRPETERASHYFMTQLGRQFDALLHFDHTRAVEPLERTPTWESGEVPETYPFNE